MWFSCANTCIFETNNPRSAAKHEEETGHRVVFAGYDIEEDEGV